MRAVEVTGTIDRQENFIGDRIAGLGEDYMVTAEQIC